METIGLVLLASLFAFAAFGHLKNHAAMVAGTAQAFGACPLAKLAFFGGIPTGLYLAATAYLIAVNEVAGFYMAAGFLALSGVLFHRNLQDPGTWKQIALAGASLALASYVA